jgi:hypothetical protein
MWYKFIQDEWYVGNRVNFPDGSVLENDHTQTKDGWVWYAEPPQAYLDWMHQQQA